MIGRGDIIGVRGYIGKTKNIEKRWNEHLSGEGSGWTKKYKPTFLMKIIVSTSYFDEDKYVKEYMAKYGIENVRGGTYSNIVLDDNSILVLEKEIRHSKNLCTRCGRDTHFIKDCYANTNSNGSIIDSVCKEKEKTVKDDKKQKVYKAKQRKNEESTGVDDLSFLDEESWKSKNTKKIVRKPVKPCDICGMKGHREVNCYNL
jgi:hypothetical protein